MKAKKNTVNILLFSTIPSTRDSVSTLPNQIPFKVIVNFIIVLFSVMIDDAVRVSESVSDDVVESEGS